MTLNICNNIGLVGAETLTKSDPWDASSLREGVRSSSKNPLLSDALMLVSITHCTVDTRNKKNKQCEGGNIHCDHNLTTASALTFYERNMKTLMCKYLSELPWRENIIWKLLVSIKLFVILQTSLF